MKADLWKDDFSQRFGESELAHNHLLARLIADTTPLHFNKTFSSL
jgi:hypothetical protein